MDKNFKIYYGASIAGAQGDNFFNRQIIASLRLYGDVLSEHLFDEDYRKNEKLSPREIHDRDCLWIGESNVLVMNVSAPSLGVGYEISKGRHLLKPTLCLWNPQNGKRLSAMIEGSPGIEVCTHKDLEGAIKGVGRFMKQLS
mgnify:CR=1 FL=1